MYMKLTRRKKKNQYQQRERTEQEGLSQQDGEKTAYQRVPDAQVDAGCHKFLGEVRPGGRDPI